MNLWILESVLSVDVRSFRVKGHVGSTVVNEFTFLGTIVYVTWSTASFIGWDYLGFDEKSYNSREFWLSPKIWNVQILVDFKLFPEKTKIFGFFLRSLQTKKQKMTMAGKCEFVGLAVIVGLFYLKWSNKNFFLKIALSGDQIFSRSTRKNPEKFWPFYLHLFYFYLEFVAQWSFIKRKLVKRRLLMS